MAEARGRGKASTGRRGRRGQLLAAAALLLVAAPHARANFTEEPWFAGLRLGGIATDQSYSKDGNVYAISVGRNFTPEYGFELEAAHDKLDFAIGYGLKHQTYGVNFLYTNPVPLWHPYFLMGVGVIKFDGPRGLPIRTGTDFMFNLGLGGRWELVVPDKLFLRADLRFRFDGNRTRQPGQDDFGDGILTFGLEMPFGK